LRAGELPTTLNEPAQPEERLARHRALNHVVSLIAIPVVWAAAAFSFSELLAPVSASDDADHHLECGIELDNVDQSDAQLARSGRVVLVTDEEWRDTMTGRHPSEARHVLLDAASLFRGMGIHLLPIRVVDWESPEDAGSIRDVWLAAQQTVPLNGADVVVVLSAQKRTNSQDGYANVGGNYVAVSHHKEQPEKDALVLAHELSHLFGAHHGCDVPGREGLMTPKGFDHDLVCPCVRRILELNADRFHMVAP
jgi:hypothetical protein